MSIVNAISYGVSALNVLSYLKQKYPQYASSIDAAQKAGFSPDKILKKLNDPNSDNPDDSSEYLTPYQRTRKNDADNRKRQALGLATLAGTTAGVAAGAYAISRQGRGIRPTAILPPLQQGPRQPPQLPGGTQPQLPYNPRGPQGPQARPNVPRGTPPQPSGPTITPPYQHDPEKNIQIIKNIKEDRRIAEALSTGLGMGAVAQLLREKIPKGKLDILERVPGGFEQALTDYDKYRRSLGSEENRVNALQEFKKRQQPIVEQETNRFEDEYGIGQQQQQEIDPIQEPNRPMEELQPKTTQVALESLPNEIAQPKEIRKESFYVPNYAHSDEPKEEFIKRKTLYDVANKAAKALTEGKSFLDFPIPPEVIKGKRTLSTASDVLRFIAGIPNIYDPLLDDEEKQQLTESFIESGIMTVPELAPTLGERNVYGAQLAPNLIWNLLLTLEPKISSMVPPSIKGSIGKEKGGKMGTTEMRRFLTHSVYGVLSGKKLSSELADKINRISAATSNVDAIVKASKAGNMKKIEEEMERLMDDKYFMEIMSQEIEDLILSKEEKEKQEILAKEDSKNAASLKAAKTRKSKKSTDLNL